MNEESKVTLYNVATFDPNSPNAEEGKLDFTNFVKTYSHMYYFHINAAFPPFCHPQLPIRYSFPAWHMPSEEINILLV